MSKHLPFEPEEMPVLGWMLDYLPPIIARKHVEQYTGGLVSSKTLANHDCRGTGPRVAYRTDNGVVYPTLFLLEWLEKRIQSQEVFTLGEDFKIKLTGVQDAETED